ncbi:MAG: hypothetical protein ACTSRZ_11745 [Promethearchaeota archaeon]
MILDNTLIKRKNDCGVSQKLYLNFFNYLDILYDGKIKNEFNKNK